ncbi:acyl-CoA dehydrogenase family protein [Kineosporia sp. NBRC 101731]|uniref:acyl-CoA dehydrogenase family protein n=1 Tax=Kineosporia sp. NBRC 101731 TaxID=3032199 RepID=UPI0024A4CD22|nr:acyl-CoA dehydrogenase family protein [Kineosporia sp. NBRC 101731]GLY28381.1 acyl-CoA dehydrogenase [Kineosporia sp. NBRC 101731]
MIPTPDPLFVQLGKSLRAGLAGLPAVGGLHGAPVDDGAHSAAGTVIEGLDAAALERPVTSGGLDLGLTAGVLVSEELGRAARGNPYRAMALAADAGVPADSADSAGHASAGLEALPAGSGVTATARAGGWELNGAVTVDDVDAGTFLVATRTGGQGVLVALPRRTPGIVVENSCWPPVARFAAAPFTAADVVARLDDSPAGPLTRARLRQAGYLLGIADGAHRTAVEYTGFRRQSGSRLRDLTAVSFPLARAMVTLRATRAAVYRGAWLVDSAPEAVGTAPITALAMAAEAARDVVRVSMQSCGVRAMTAELDLHRYFRLAVAESARYGDPAALWRTAGADLYRRVELRALEQARS